MTEKHILGVSKIHRGYKCTIVKKVRNLLDLDVGDSLVFISENGQIMIEKT